MKRGWRWAVATALGLPVVAALVTAGACLTSGCSNLAYYAQSVRGHVDLMQRARPVTELVADPATPAPLRDRLELTQRIRDFAVAELKLPDNASYRRYADLQRPAAVWNVVAAPELSLKLKTWCFPVVGCVGYRGYYDRAEADALAASLRLEGLEVSVYPVPAYSTLGKLNWLGGDPLLNTFVQNPEAEVARLVFHELAHQVAFADGDTAFNESFATSVERIGLRRWLSMEAADDARLAHERLEQRRRDFRELTAVTRRELEAAYAGERPDDVKRIAKAEAMARLRDRYEALKRGPWGGYDGYDGWVARANNASFGVQAAYLDLVPAFERLYEREGRDFDRYYAAVQRLAALPKAERHATLTGMAPAPSAP